MSETLNHRIKDIAIFGCIFLGMSVVISTFLNLSRDLATSLSDNMLTAGAAIIGILIGLILYNILIKIRKKGGWEKTIITYTILIGLGGLIYNFIPPAIILVGIGAPGLLNFIIPTHSATWSKRIFGEKQSKRSLIGVSFAAFSIFYSIMLVLNATGSFITGFSIALIVIGVWIFLWVYFGFYYRQFRIANLLHHFHLDHLIQRIEVIYEKFKINFLESDYMPKIDKTHHNYMTKYIVNLISIIGWNFVFLMLIEYWYYYFNPSLLGLTIPQNTINGVEIGILLVGLGIMIITEFFLRHKLSQMYIISLIFVIIYFATLSIFYLNLFGNNPVLKFVMLLISMGTMPVFVAGLLECAPFEFDDKWLNLLQIAFIFVDLIFVIISTTFFPNLFVLYLHNTMWPTVFLLNAIFIGFAFIFNILRHSVKDDEAELTSISSIEEEPLVFDKNAPDIDSGG